MVIMNTFWKISVNELLNIFRGALLALIPWLEKAKISWKDDEAYDDWDNIVESLYKNIVCASLYSEVADNYSIAKYLYTYDNYSLIDYIEIRIKDNSEKKFAFVAFQSDFSPLDSIKVAELDKKNKVIGYINLKIDDFEFLFVKNINGKKEVIHDVEVTL